MDTTNPPESRTGRFLAMLSARRKQLVERRQVEDAAFIEMLLRMFRALELRVIERPENLPQIMTLVERLAEVPNVVIAINADRYKIDPAMGWSMAECARALGMTDPAASKRRRKGNDVITERLDAAGATRFAEARREQTAIAAAYEHVVEAIDAAAGEPLSPAAQASRARAVVALDTYRARHAAA